MPVPVQVVARDIAGRESGEGPEGGERRARGSAVSRKRIPPWLVAFAPAAVSREHLGSSLSSLGVASTASILQNWFRKPLLQSQGLELKRYVVVTLKGLEATAPRLFQGGRGSRPYSLKLLVAQSAAVPNASRVVGHTTSRASQWWPRSLGHSLAQPRFATRSKPRPPPCPLDGRLTDAPGRSAGRG